MTMDNYIRFFHTLYTVNEYTELKKLQALAERAKQKLVPKFEDKVIKKLPKKILIQQN